MSRTVLVTGGGSGFGFAVATRFAKDGDQVYITGRRADLLDKACTILGENVRALPCDGTDPDVVERVASEIEGEVDILVNNAGGLRDLGMPPAAGLRETLERWRANLDANLTTAVLMTEALFDRLARGGALVHIGSLAADQGSGSYGAAKAALASYSVGLAQMLGPRDVTSNVVAPGYIPDTEFFGTGLPTDFHDQLVAQTMLGRHGNREEVADTVYFLASPSARFITGQVINVNGGVRTTR